MADTKEGLRSNPLIEEIRNLGKNLVPISGYLQKDEAKDTWRLYRSLAFDEYLRFGKDVVEFVFQVSKDHQKQGDPEALSLPLCGLAVQLRLTAYRLFWWVI